MAVQDFDSVPSSHDAGGSARLGIDQPAGWWPTAPRLKSYEAAGFAFVQVKLPSRALLATPKSVDRHAGALRENLRLTELRLVIHAPDDLLAGTAEHDRQLRAALYYASLAGAELLVYHGARVPAAAPDAPERLRDEERSLRRVLAHARTCGVRLAIENLAPVYPGPALACHDPGVVAALVRRLGSEQAGMCLDLGHAHITSGLAARELPAVIEPLLERVILFHVHDNFGAWPDGQRAGSIEPGRLDLHLPPGAGSIPWAALAPLLAAHPAPLQLEVHPGLRPEPATLAVVARELLGLAAATKPHGGPHDSGA